MEPTAPADVPLDEPKPEPEPESAALPPPPPPPEPRAGGRAASPPPVSPPERGAASGGDECGSAALPEELWSEVFDRVSAEGAQGHRSWVQTQCRLRQSCSKFRLEGGHAERARRFCAREWPQLSRSLAARQLPSAGVDWADVCRTQMQRGRQLAPGLAEGAALVRLCAHTPPGPDGAAACGHSEWVTCTKFFSGALPRNEGSSTAAEERPARSFRSSCRRGALGGQTGLVSCSYDGSIRFWDLTRHSEFREGDPEGGGGVAHSSGGIECCAVFRPENTPARGHNQFLFSCLSFSEEAGVVVVRPTQAWPELWLKKVSKRSELTSGCLGRRRGTSTTTRSSAGGSTTAAIPCPPSSARSASRTASISTQSSSSSPARTASSACSVHPQHVLLQAENGRFEAAEVKWLLGAQTRWKRRRRSWGSWRGTRLAR